MAFLVTKLGVFAGYSIQTLSPDAIVHEQEKVFKAAFETYLLTEIPTYNQATWANYPDPPIGFWFDDTTGSAELTDVKNYLIEVMQPGGGGGIVIGPVIHQGCDNSPTGWERSRTFQVAKNSVKMTMLGVVSIYTPPPGLPVLTEEIKVALGALDIHFTVRWTSSDK